MLYFNKIVFTDTIKANLTIVSKILKMNYYCINYYQTKVWYNNAINIFGIDNLIGHIFNIQQDMWFELSSFDSYFLFLCIKL